MAGAKPDEELRTPMLWGGDDPMTTSWHPSRYNRRTVPVADQAADPGSLLNAYREAAALRRENPALNAGSFSPYAADNPIPIAFIREAPGQRLLVIHNPSANAQALSLPEGAASLRDGAPAAASAELAPYGSLIFTLPEAAR